MLLSEDHGTFGVLHGVHELAGVELREGQQQHGAHAHLELLRGVVESLLEHLDRVGEAVEVNLHAGQQVQRPCSIQAARHGVDDPVQQCRGMR